MNTPLNQDTTANKHLMPGQRFALFNLMIAQWFGSTAQLTMATLSALVGATLAPTPKLATMAIASLSAGALLDGIGWVWTNLISLALLALVVIALLRNRGPAKAGPDYLET